MKKLMLILFLISIILISGCDTIKTVDSVKVGFLEGKVNIGPICPVASYPPDPKCQPTEETYKAWPIVVWDKDKIVIISKITPDVNGNFKIELITNNYIIDFENEKQFYGVGGSNLPIKIDIKPKETTKIDINIDTGIR